MSVSRRRIAARAAAHAASATALPGPTAQRLAAGTALTDVAPRGWATQSSTSAWSQPEDAKGALGPHGRDFGFHTGLEAGPWWQLAFDRLRPVHYILLHNRLRQHRDRAAALTVEVSRDGQSWTLVHRGLCHFGGDRDTEAGGPLVLPLGGRLEVAHLRLSLPGVSCLHLDRVEVLAPGEAAPAAEVTAPAERVFLTTRRDGFGERLRALMNAIILAERFGGTFGLIWEESREHDKAAHAILPAERTFAAAFLAAHVLSPGASGARPRGTRPLTPAALRAGGGRFRVEQHDLATVLPDLDPPLGREAGAAAFRRIRFSDPLERARAAAEAVDLGGTAAAIHLRAGDIIYGPHRLVGHFASKVVAWPLALGLAERLAAAGHRVIVFGQDQALCRHAAAGAGRLFAGDLAAEQGFDLHQSVLFEIALMARCSEIFAGASGFALAACQIAGTAPARIEDRLGREAVRALLLGALQAEEAGGAAGTAVSELQHAFAMWSAVFTQGDLFDAGERRRFLAAAASRDPANALYRIAGIAARLEAGETAAAAADLEALVVAEAAQPEGTLRFVLTRRRQDGRSVASRLVQNFETLARRDHPGALLCLALGARDATRARTAAARFLEVRPPALAAYDTDARQVLGR